MTNTEQREERWALSESEMTHIERLNSNDELMGTYQYTDKNSRPVGDLHQVVVRRNGTVTNHNMDGTIGVSKEVREFLESEDSLYHPVRDGNGDATDDYSEMTTQWRNVVVNREGNFVSWAEDKPAPSI
jgi:hypothetical protein